MSKNHYVYKLTHKVTGEFYYGVRSTKYDPSLDGYMGSMKTWNPDKTKLTKEIIKLFPTRDEANDFERKIISENIDNELNRNYHIPNKGFHTLDMPLVYDKKENKNKRITPTEWKDNPDRYESISKGKTNALNIETGEWENVSIHIFWENREKYKSPIEIYGDKIYGKSKYNFLKWQIKNGNPMKGKKHTEETKKQISKSKKGTGIGKDNSQYGKPKSQETKQKIRDKLIKHPSGLTFKERRAKSSKERKEKIKKENIETALRIYNSFLDSDYESLTKFCKVGLAEGKSQGALSAFFKRWIPDIYNPSKKIPLKLDIKNKK